MDASSKVRQNAEQMRDVLQDLKAWEAKTKQNENNYHEVKRSKANTSSIRNQIESVPFNELKINAKECFSKGNYAMAKKYYKHALERAFAANKEEFKNIDLRKEKSMLFSNIALIKLKQKKYAKVEVYSNKAMDTIGVFKYEEEDVDVKSLVVKTLMRRGTARMKLGYLKNASIDFKMCLEFEKNNSECKKLLIKAREMRMKALKHEDYPSVKLVIQ